MVMEKKTIEEMKKYEMKENEKNGKRTER